MQTYSPLQLADLSDDAIAARLAYAQDRLDVLRQTGATLALRADLFADEDAFTAEIARRNACDCPDRAR